MKKVLLTTSALTLLAGAAAADVSMGGYARLGVSNSDGATTNYQRNQITFTGSAATDGGLTLSSWTRYRQSAGASVYSGTGAFAAPRLSISNGAMTLTAGNAAGAIGANSGLWGCGAVMWGCADVTNDSWSWASTSSTGTGPNVVRLDMALGGASVSLSGGNGNDTEASLSMALGGGSIGVGYDEGHATALVAQSGGTDSSFDAAADATPLITTDAVVGVFTAGADGAAATAAVAKASTVSINYSGTMGGMGVGVRMAQSAGATGYMFNVSAPMAAGSVYVFAGKTLGASNNYGLRYNQSLGGGASLQAGVTSAGGTTTVGGGVAFGF